MLNSTSYYHLPLRCLPAYTLHAGMVTAYKNSFNYVGLSGPTYFAPTIQQAHRIAQADAQAERLKYTVLLLLTE